MKTNSLSTRAILLINLILVQTLIFIFTALYLYLWFNGKDIFRIISWQAVATVLLFSGIIFSILAIYLVAEIVRLAEKEADSEVTKARLLDSKNLIDVLKTQRHDFINHLQVVSGLGQLGHPQKVVEYVKQISSEINISGKLVHIAIPEVAVILLNKMAKAQGKMIKVSTDIRTSLAKIRVSTIELTSIISNLIDNAIFALDGVNSDEKVLKITLYENENDYVFEIYNSLPIIPDDMQKQVFKKGFSTKQGQEHGYGLSIVQEMTEKNGGQVFLRSKENEGTTFTVTLPM